MDTVVRRSRARLRGVRARLGSRPAAWAVSLALHAAGLLWLSASPLQSSGGGGGWASGGAGFDVTLIQAGDLGTPEGSELQTEPAAERSGAEERASEAAPQEAGEVPEPPAESEPQEPEPAEPEPEPAEPEPAEPEPPVLTAVSARPVFRARSQEVRSLPPVEAAPPTSVAALLLPSPLDPSPLEPEASEPEALDPSPLDPSPLDPSPLEPEALEPEALEPEALEPEPSEPEARPPTLGPEEPPGASSASGPELAEESSGPAGPDGDAEASAPGALGAGAGSDPGASGPSGGAGPAYDGGDAVLTYAVRPSYPRPARRAGIQGAVTVAFTILSDGVTADIEIVESDPPGVFDRAAIEAVAQWRYLPPRIDGVVVDRPNVEVTVDFVLEGRRRSIQRF